VTAPELDQLAYSRQEAARVSGYSQDTINKAVLAGELRERHPVINGRPMARGVILRADLQRWLEGNP
jgi:hypothetical protein